jgi:MFS family permease
MRRLGAAVPSRPDPLVAKYYLYQATVTFGFFWPVFTIFLLDRGLSYTQIALLGSLSAGVSVVGEVPTGYVGDRIGRRDSLLLGSTALALSVYGLAVAETFVGFVVVYAVWALGGAFRSGAGDAWLYDVLAERLDEDAYTRVRGRGGAVNMGVTAATMLAAGGLYAVDPVLPFLVGGTVNAAGVGVLLTMPRVEPGGDDDQLGVRQTARIVGRQLLRPPVRSVVLGVALFFGVVGAADTYIQPIAVEVVGLPTAVLGPLYTGFAILGAAASYAADPVERRLGARTALFVVPAVVAVLLVAPLAVGALVLPGLVVMRAARELVAPLASGYLNDNVGSLRRATVLSAAAMVYGTARLVFKPLGGVVADALGPVAAVAALGGLLVAGLLIVRGTAGLAAAPDDAADPAVEPE